MRTGFAPHQLARHEMRHRAAHAILTESGASSVLDLGCGDGQFIERLAADHQFSVLTGVDESIDSLRVAAEFSDPIEESRDDLTIAYHAGSLLTASLALPRHEAVTMIEVIEHFRLDDLPEVERVIFERLQPDVVVFTTPSAVPVDGLDVRTRPKRRHDHHFEWTPDEARTWLEGAGERHGYNPHHEVISTKPLPGLDLQVISFSRRTSIPA
ncbi:MAG: class I SAM-dependent methyltransferase [Candidatus Saccharimonadales bacterium]